MDVLGFAFNKKKAFYKGAKGNWNVTHMQGLPEVRLKTADRFRHKGGFALLHQYLLATAGTSSFPKLETLNHILVAVGDLLVAPRTVPAGHDPSKALAQLEDDSLLVANAAMDVISRTDEDALKKMSSDALSDLQRNLQRIYDRMVVTRRDQTHDFYAVWRNFALRLIRSQSLPLKLFGWSQVDELIAASAVHRPPPRAFLVSGAGCAFANGAYWYNGPVTDDGYARPGSEISYVRQIPPNRDEAGSGKKLTIFRCTMRSQQKWWFLSEADEEQPGTDRDVDYYQHKSKEHEEAYPPPDGWFTCRTAGVEPPPHLEPRGVVVPPGKEHDTLDHRLAQWAIENEIVEQVLGDTTIHREVVARSTVLIKFLALMWNRYPPPLDAATLSTSSGLSLQPAPSVPPSLPSTPKYCLQASHLLFAWKTCLRKADAAVSAQVYALLVSTLPLCPTDLAIPLLKAVLESLHASDDKRDYRFEVSEFCSALASGNLLESSSPASKSSGSVPPLKDEVREEALNLMWSVLTQCDPKSLRNYDALKHYVDVELRVEPKGAEHREKFLRHCISALADGARTANAPVDEVLALRTVRLTHFVVDACPRNQAERIVGDASVALPQLLFDELCSYLLRRKNVAGSGFVVVRKPGNSVPANTVGASSVESDAKQHLEALSHRLKMLRHVFGLSDVFNPPTQAVVLSYEMIERLWQLCDAPDDRAALMVFIASASRAGRISFDNTNPSPSHTVLPQPPLQPEQLFSAAFSESVSHSVFLNLFCSPSFTYDHLSDGAYKSFQFLFNACRSSPSSSADAKKAAVDALWRICLAVEDDKVASQARKDLLEVYTKPTTSASRADGHSAAPDMMLEERFVDRILDCLARVKRELDAGTEFASRSADRCLRILNAAIGQDSLEANSITTSSLIRLSSLDGAAGLDDVMKCLPHGMRGQAANIRVGVVAKRPNLQTSPKEGVPATPRPPPSVRFPLDLHPLESLASVKSKVAEFCQCTITSVKPIQVSGRAQSRISGDAAQMNLNLVPEDTVVDEVGIVDGCEIVFVIAERAVPTSTPAMPAPKTSRSPFTNDLSGLFYSDDGKVADSLFSVLLDMLKSLSSKLPDGMVESADSSSPDTHKLAWDFLLAMPTNPSIESRVKSVPGQSPDAPSIASVDDPMEVEVTIETWSQLLDPQNFDRSVYVLLTIDSLLRPSKEVVSILPEPHRRALQEAMDREATSFRRSFIDAGGFDAVVRFFSAKESVVDCRPGRTRRGNAVTLRILKACLFGDIVAPQSPIELSPDDIGGLLLSSLSDAEGLLRSLIAMVVDDPGISSSTITDVLRFLRLLLQSPTAARSFVSLPNGMAERFLAIPLMHDEDPENTRSSAVSAALVVRRSAHDLILQTTVLADSALPWLVKSIDSIDLSSESTSEYFDVLEKLVGEGERRETARTRDVSVSELRELGTMVCKKLASCPRPMSESDTNDFSTGVLCGCLKLLRALVENGGPNALLPGTEILLTELNVNRWSKAMGDSADPHSVIMGSNLDQGDSTLIDLMGCIFDGFLSPGGVSSVSICCEKESRRKGFEVIASVARSCRGKDGYLALVSRIDGLISAAAPNLRHRWGQFGGSTTELSARSRGPSKYSGLRNQGCTCYMNSVLQQLFMMPELRNSMCSAPLPSRLRTSGGTMTKGSEIVGKRISLQWENGVTYDAMVEGYDEATGMHRILYCATQVASGGQGHQQVDPDEIARLPPQLPDEFILSEGRPGKETGVFEITRSSMESGGDNVAMEDANSSLGNVQETQDEAASRHLLEEVQRTFIHLDEGSRGRCFDPRALVEACACLKLEFDVWQQNDASEFTSKLLDRLEIALKKYAPNHFHYLDHTFGIKVTKQKICKECGLKTNREEKHINLNCEIRGKTDILEALAAMMEDEIMEGSNRVSCDVCKKKTDTILRTAISTMPNMLILSLKRFDLDYNTFETVKLNSRCAFAEKLNLKPYTLEGLEAKEKTQVSTLDDPAPMDTDEDVLDSQTEAVEMADEDCEYRLVGVLVHAGVAQGGHYYSFIKDRYPGSEAKWYRFDDEDVTPFDPVSIETECFGGKVKKETKWPNGQVHTVEQEQFANALILFYEKVKPTDLPPLKDEQKKDDLDESSKVAVPQPSVSGYDVFKADVQRSNATHKWQSFLFDPELQAFLKGLLGLCGVVSNSPELSPSSGPSMYWRQSLVQMILSFVFDVLLYSSDRSFLADWTRMLEEVLLSDPYSGKVTVHKLAVKTKEVSSNWLRTFLLECPDPNARSSSILVFAAAMKSCLFLDQELQALDRWCVAWEDQAKSLKLDSPAPCSLEGQWAVCEDLRKMDGQGSTGVGVVVSFLNVLLEATPRCWRQSSELNSFIRHLASMQLDKSEYGLRRAMVSALIPPRLAAVVVRERLVPPHFRLMFPGACLSVDAAFTQVRPETTHNVMSMASSHLHNADSNSPRIPSQNDYLTLLEALASVGGLPGCTHVQLTHDSGEVTRSRRRYILSEAATQALATIFHENCFGSPGMGQREIELYLQRSGVDSSQVTSQKIVEMLSKYPTTTGPGIAAGPKYLSLDGFLAYYRDAIQSNDVRLRHDLHVFGYRPDLSRRSLGARQTHIGERISIFNPAESVARDVAEVFGAHHVPFGSLGDKCLANTSHLFNVAFSVSEPLAQYLVAGAAYLKPTDDLIDRILQAIFHSHSDWSGSDAVMGASLALQVIATLPGQDREARVHRIMESPTPANRSMESGGLGLLPVLRSLHHARQTQHYNNELLWTYSRYIDIVKTLRQVHPVYSWMSENRGAWVLFERDLVEGRHTLSPQQVHSVRSGDYGGTRDGVSIPDRIAVPLDHHGHSDSDLAGMNDSEDDDDSHFELADQEEPSTNDGPYQIIVDGAGNPSINGVYDQDGHFQGACRYARTGRWESRPHRFAIFQCNVSNNTKHWYISIVPPGTVPGTSADIDFYTAPVNDDCRVVPPRTGWVKAQCGEGNSPVLSYSHKPPDEDMNGAVGGPPGNWDDSLDDEPPENSSSFV